MYSALPHGDSLQYTTEEPATGQHADSLGYVPGRKLEQSAIVQPDPNIHFSGWRLVSMMCTRPRPLESMAPEGAHCVYGIYALT
jgi:hypothetical protein